VICCSHEAMQAQSALSPARPTRVVYLGADLERFDPEHLASPAELRQELGLPSGGAVIGVFCRLQRWKGVEILIDAIALVRRSNDDVHLVTVGGQHSEEPGHLAELVDRIDAHGLSAHVSMVGH
jgi:glycosyltransferase involved in cell wall biosynthesis